MVEIRFFPLDVTYKNKENQSYIYLYGKTQEGRQVCVVEKSEPYFYVEGKGDLGLLRKEIEGMKTEYKGKEIQVTHTGETEKLYKGQKIRLIKVFINLPAGKNLLRRKIEEKGLRCFEYDIGFTSQYLRDRDLVPLTLLKAEGNYAEERSKVPVFRAEKIELESSEMLSDLKVLSFDIETYAKERAIIPEKNPILMIAFYGVQRAKREDGQEEEKLFQKVITWKRFKTELDYIEFVDSEESLIKRFKEFIENYKPDILTGYFSDGFDLPYLQSRAEVYGIDLDLGKDYSNLAVKGREEYAARIAGLVHLDIFKFIRNIIGKNMKTESFSLDSVARELIGHGKQEVNLDGLASIWDDKPEELEEFCKYNLHDAYLTYELCVKLLPNMLELIKLTGLTLFEINRMGFSRLVEAYILKRSKEFDILALNRPNYKEVEWRRRQTYEGAFVFEPEPAVYENLVVFDFRSLYPTIITAHNIDPNTLSCGCCELGEKVPGKEFRFCKKKKGFFPTIIEDLISRRMRVKEMIRAMKEKKEDSTLLEARSYGLKTVANAFYGYMGFFAARWYCLECVQSVTAYARDYIKNTIAKAEEAGFKVRYSDTDSIFLELGSKTKEEALELMKEINDSLPEFMELEYEGFYPRGLFVAAKGKNHGAKKKYALFDGEELKIVGFESVRRNWSLIAKETQDKVLQIVLQENDTAKALAYVRGVADKIKNKEVEMIKMVMKTQLTKPINQYESVGPHVAVAQRMQEKGYDIVPGMVISFVVGRGSGLIREKAKMVEEVPEGEYDADYYIENQIIPAVSGIFSIVGIKEEDILKEKEQKGLGDWI